jgi:DNA ligase (NAD+)
MPGMSNGISEKSRRSKPLCPNFYGCPPQIIGRIQHFISRKAMDIEGLGGETVALLFLITDWFIIMLIYMN